MENRQDDEEVDLVVIGATTQAQSTKSPPSKKRRLVKVDDKGGLSSASSAPFAKFATDMAAAKKKAEAEALALKHKVPKVKVPFYYDNKSFAVSASRGFIRQLEKENWKNFMSFVKEIAAPVGSEAEGSSALRVVETDLDHPGSREEATPVVPSASRPEMVEKKSKKSFVGNVAPKFRVRSSAQRYVKNISVITGLTICLLRVDLLLCIVILARRLQLPGMLRWRSPLPLLQLARA